MIIKLIINDNKVYCACNEWFKDDDYYRHLWELR